MTVTRQAVMSHTLELLARLAGDWDYEGEISADTGLFSELGFQSLDAVILGNSLQEQFGQIIPYGDLLADVGQRKVKDITVGEWVNFSCEHLEHHSSGGLS